PKPTAEPSRWVGRGNFRHAICGERFIGARSVAACHRSAGGSPAGPPPARPQSAKRQRAAGGPAAEPAALRYSHSPQPAPILLLPHRVKLKAMIFDVDGTLVDSNDIHARCWIEAFEHFGKHFQWDVVRHQIGKGGDLLVPDLLNAREMRTFGEELKKYRSKLYKDKYLKDVKPFPRVRELFETLHGRGIKLALGSSSNQDEVKY